MRCLHHGLWRVRVSGVRVIFQLPIAKGLSFPRSMEVLGFGLNHVSTP